MKIYPHKDFLRRRVFSVDELTQDLTERLYAKYGYRLCYFSYCCGSPDVCDVTDCEGRVIPPGDAKLYAAHNALFVAVLTVGDYNKLLGWHGMVCAGPAKGCTQELFNRYYDKFVALAR